MIDANSKEPELNLCDLEPVQFIGSIQPFGMLFACNEIDFILEQASQNSSTLLGTELTSILGTKIENIFGESFAQALRARQTPIFLDHWIATAQQQTGRIILEIEQRDPNPITGADESHTAANGIITRLYDTSSLLDLCKTVTFETQKLTNFDRIMVYKFHDDFHGEVIAEAVKPEVDSYLGLHYPSSDIPTPARIIFEKNWIRMIPDVNYQPVPIHPLPQLGFKGPLDLSRSILRGVSPVHIEYLKNMNVGASLTLSLLNEGRLWGLISCHHLKTKFIDFRVRMLCELIAKVTSHLLTVKKNLEMTREKEKRRAIHQALIHEMERTRDEDLGKTLIKNSPNLLDLISAENTAAALHIEGKWITIGKVPKPKDLDKLVSWLAQNQSGNKIFQTNSLPELYPDALAFKDLGCGLLAISLPKNTKIYILYFRPELIQTIVWAGDPEKSVDLQHEGLTLHPRKSFKAWKKSVTLKAAKWEPWEISLAQEFRNSVAEVDLQRQFDRAERAQIEIRARDELMAMLSHDLKNPINAIQLSLSLISKIASKDSLPQIKGIIEISLRATNIMNHLVQDILDVTRIEAASINIEKEQVEAGEMITEAIEMLSQMANEKNIRLVKVLPSEDCYVCCDRVKIFQALSNLISNAIKFTPQFGKITISAKRIGSDYLQFSVSDTGCGIPKENLGHIFDRFWQAEKAKKFGTGLGLAIVRGIVETHGGRIWTESEEGRGSTFFFTLPAHREM